MSVPSNMSEPSIAAAAATATEIQPPPQRPGIHPGSGKPADRNQLIAMFKTIVGKPYVLTDAEATRRYRTGFRFGDGQALAVVRPGTLLSNGAFYSSASKQTLSSSRKRPTPA